MSDDQSQYRKFLVETEQRITESYDKTVVALSGGALGLSLVFIKDVVSDNEPIGSSHLLLSWIFLTSSLTSVVLSLFFGTLAYRKAIVELDEDSVARRAPGGKFAKPTFCLHIAGVLFLVVGLLFLGLFVTRNV